MAYLVFKLFLLLLLAAFLGFLLGRWWVRRQFRDVTEEYRRVVKSTQDAEQRFDTLERLIGQLRLEPLHDRLDRLESAMNGIETRDARDLANLSSQGSEAPVLYDTPSRGEPDDLKRISGVGPALESMLHDLGVYYFDQVASWDENQVDYVNSRLTAFKGRIRRDRWVAQAKMLVSAGDRPPPGEGGDGARGSDSPLTEQSPR